MLCQSALSTYTALAGRKKQHRKNPCELGSIYLDNVKPHRRMKKFVNGPLLNIQSKYVANSEKSKYQACKGIY